MSGTVDPRAIRRWQEEVARDPGHPSFVPLAESYRREGRAEVARRLCIRGLTRAPRSVEGHGLLARIYMELGEYEKAIDEWDIVLRLDPGHPAARREHARLLRARGVAPTPGAGSRAAVPTSPSHAVPDASPVRSMAGQRPRASSASARAPEDPPRPKPGTGRPAPEGDLRFGSTGLLAVERALDAFVRESGVDLVVLMETDGSILIQRGFTGDVDLAAFASLGAGIHAASQQLANLLGERQFEQLFQGADDNQIFLGGISSGGTTLLLLCTLGTNASIGLVRVAFRTLSDQVAAAPRARRPRDAAPRAGFELEAKLATRLTRALTGRRESRLPDPSG